jgi:hypothetical protein
MNELVFQVEFLSDIVLPATSNTEGNITQLDFIAGSAFLGMVAKNYDKFHNSFDIFHSGKVRFGDATLLKDGKQTYKMPLSYFHAKLDDSIIYNHHHLSKEDFENFQKNRIQLKQKREGYIAKEQEAVFVDYNYSQKSGYDTENRKSKYSSMYGYKALQAGLKWQFVIRYNGISEADLELIKSTIIGKKQLGKSKSAQYGLVSIELAGQNKSIEDTANKDEVVLYANSRLALTNENGNPTLDVKYLCDGLDGKVIYDKTQIRTSTFTPYNAARQTKDYERVCINKGSVIVLQNITDDQLARIKRGVGAFLSEGFGEILVNPSFLREKSFTNDKKPSQDEHKTDKMIEIVQKSDNPTVQFLINRHNTKIVTLKLANAVDAFIAENRTIYSNIKNSQWGNIRSICNSPESGYIEEIRKYISNGTKMWDDKQIKILLDCNPKQEFLKLLAMQMPKAIEKSKGAKK